MAKTMVKSASLPPVMNVFSPLMIQSSNRPCGRVVRIVGGVRPGAGLGDREAGDLVALDGRQQVLLLLLVVGVEQDVVGITLDQVRSSTSPTTPQRPTEPLTLHGLRRRFVGLNVYSGLLALLRR